MKSYNIAVIGGDGTGPEVVREAIKVLDVAAKKFELKLNYTDYDLGGARYLRTGEVLVETLDPRLFAPGSRVLDMGTGSGVGAVAAARLGARGREEGVEAPSEDGLSAHGP